MKNLILFLRRNRIVPLWLVGALLTTQAAYGLTLLVYNNNDVGAGSLRQAVADNRALGGGNTIDFSNIVTGTITLTAAELLITNNLTIQGPGASVLTLSGNNSHRIFNLVNTTVAVSGLTIAFGRTNFGGGGIYMNGGSLAMNNCVVVSNTAYSSFLGGGVLAQGSFTATNCTFFTNVATGSGNFEAGGAISSSGPLALVNCAVLQNYCTGVAGGGLDARAATTGVIINTTFYGNHCGAEAGAIMNAGDLSVTSCTFTKNDAAVYGGAIYNTGTMTVRNTIVAGNTNSSGTSWDCYGTFISGGYNLIGSSSGSTGWGALGDQTGTTNSRINALLAPAASNSGITPTVRLLPGSPAIDQGKSFGLTTDQRGRNRPYDNPAIPNAAAGDASDIGAFEISGATLVVSNKNDNGAGSLRQTIADASSFEGDTISFAPGLIGSIVLTNGSLAVDKDLTLSGPGARFLTVSGNTNGHIFDLIAGNVTISGLTLANGRYVGTGGGFEQNGAQARGGGIFNQTILALNDCILSNNVVIGGQGGQTASGFAGGGGNGLGGGIVNIGTVTMTNCYLVANSASGGNGGVATSGGFDGSGGQGFGGGIYSSGPLTLVRCALAKNIANGAPGGGGAGSGSGGGIYNDADVTLLTCTVASNSASGSSFDFGGGIFDNGTSVTIRGSTIAGNQADFGGGLSLSAAANCGDTVLAYNTAGSGPDCSGTINSSDYNLIQNTSGATITGTTTHNLTGQNPQLSPLADNGGLSPTMAPLAGSPILDKGKNFGPATDQRGAPRPFDFSGIANAAGGDGSDIGAFESGSPQLNIQKIGTSAVLSWPAYYGGFTVQSLTNLSLANSWTAVGGAPTLNGNQYVFTNGPITGDQFYRLQGN